MSIILDFNAIEQALTACLYSFSHLYLDPIYYKTFKTNIMKPKLKSVLFLAGASFIVLTGCKKEDSLGGSSAQSTAAYRDDMRDVSTKQFKAEVPLAWYKLAIKLARTKPDRRG